VISCSVGNGNVEVQGVCKFFGSTVAFIQVDLIVISGGFLTLLGPSGCGISTLLRLFSGFVKPTTGEKVLYGSLMNAIPPENGPSNIVFQKYALFPH
jgi:ABC-type spermidine/putrescine transport systems, ATPase components